MACDSVLFSSYALDCLNFHDLMSSLDQRSVGIMHSINVMTMTVNIRTDGWICNPHLFLCAKRTEI